MKWRVFGHTALMTVYGLAVLAHCASAFAAPGATAASSASSAGEMPDSVSALAELNVVALKQSDILRRDPVAATVLGRGELEAANAVALKSISDMVPNLYIPDYGSRITSTIYVRGIGARMDQPAVGLTVDNVPFLNKNSFDFDLADIASVEMMRGPQSTLYGRNTIGGLINIETLSPMRWQGLRMMAFGGRGGDFRASLGWYHKGSERFATSVALSGSALGGFWRNALTGKKVDHEQSGALRWKTEWKPSPRISFSNTASASILRQGGYPYESVASGQIAWNDTCFYRRFIINDGLTMRWRAEKFTMSAIASLQWLDDNMTLDQDFLPQSYFNLTQRQHDLSTTCDLLFRGNRHECEGGYRWMAGAFGFWKSTDMRAPVTFKDDGIANLIENHRNDANPYYPVAWDTREFVLGSKFRLPSFGWALYHQSELTLGPWQLSLGLRLDWEQSRLSYHSDCNTGYMIHRLLPDGTLVPERHVDVDIADRGRLHRTYVNFLPRLTALYSLPLEGINNLYVNLSKGYKAGGFNTQMFSDVLQQRLMGVMGIGAKYDIDDVVGYRPEYSWNYELGAHLSWPGINLESELALFYIDCRDQQLTMFPSGSTTGRVMTNAGHTRSCGLEASLTWTPSDRWRLEGSYGLTDARFVRFYNGISDFSGMRIPYVPRNTCYLGAGYTLPIGGNRTLAFNADMRGTGRVYWNEDNSVSQPFYVVGGASSTLDMGNWSIQIWGKNITNTHYKTFYFKSMGNEFLQRGRPWQVGLTFRMDVSLSKH